MRRFVILLPVVGSSQPQIEPDHHPLPIPQVLRAPRPTGFAGDYANHEHVFALMKEYGVSVMELTSNLKTSSSLAYANLAAPFAKRLDRLLASSDDTVELFEVLEKYLFVAGELASHPTMQGETLIDWEDIDKWLDAKICPLVHSGEMLEMFHEKFRAVMANRQMSVIEKPSPQATPLANLAYLCDLQPNVVLRYLVLFDRIQRHRVSEQNVQLVVAFQASIDSVLYQLAMTPAGRLQIRYSDMPWGYRDLVDLLPNWFRRTVESLFSGNTYFEQPDALGIFYLKPALDGVEYFAIGKLLALSLIHGLPIGRNLNHGLCLALLGTPSTYGALQAGFWSMLPVGVLQNTVSAKDLVQILQGEPLPEFALEGALEHFDQEAGERLLVLTTEWMAVPVAGAPDIEIQFRYNAQLANNLILISSKKHRLEHGSFDDEASLRGAFSAAMSGPIAAPFSPTKRLEGVCFPRRKQVVYREEQVGELEGMVIKYEPSWFANYDHIAKQLTGFETGSEQVYLALKGPELFGFLLEELMRRGGVVSPDVVAKVFPIVLTLILLVGELASRPTTLGADPFLLDLVPSNFLCQFFRLPEFGIIVKRPVRGMLTRRGNAFTNSVMSMVSPHSSVAENRLSVSPLANFPSICHLRHNVHTQRVILFHRIARAHYRMEVGPAHLSTHPIEYDFEISDMLENIAQTDPQVLARKLDIRYTDRDSFGPGVYQDWFLRVFRKVLSANSLFVFDPESDGGVYRVNPRFGNAVEHQRKYVAIGRLLALSILDSLPVGQKFNFAMFKVIVDFKSTTADILFTQTDLEMDNKHVYFRLTQTRDNQRHANFPLFQFATIDGSETPLSPDETDQDLTAENVDHWAELATRHYLLTRNEIAYNAIATGLYEILPVGVFVGVFTPQNLQAWIRGETVLPTKVLMEFIEYDEYPDVQRKVTTSQWLERLFDERGADFRSKFLSFVTALKALPIGGLQGQMITIRYKPDDTRLPEAHTCFYLLELPHYSTYERFSEMITTALANDEMTLH